METKHTPTPWKIYKSTGKTGRAIGPSPEIIVARTTPCKDPQGQHHSKHNAAFIVKAVNCHDELIIGMEALIEAAEVMQAEYKSPGFAMVISLAHEIVAKAKES